MKRLNIVSVVAALLVAVSIPSSAVIQTDAATTATGYTKASDVDYVTSGSYIANWGARDEDCTFLSKYAQSFYTGNYSYSTLSQKSGGSSQTNASTSSLYRALQDMMKAEHDHQTSYGETRSLYRYTDCVSNNYSNISSFYSGKTLTGAWDGGSTWNREHTWPNSKGLGGNDENDIMMLRPTWVQENSSRGNTAYGQSSGYYDPNSEGQNLRGDCARICLYVYVRWGNTSYMWGKSGVMESLTVLLDWMEADPVDTWEMGRNDSVESITGTRNVFVDYPEYAWLLFGRDIPDDMSTPSGIANDRENTSSSSEKEESSSSSSSASSSEKDSSSAGGDHSFDRPDSSSSESSNDCNHEYGKWFTVEKPTTTTEGYKERFCELCGASDKEILPVLSDCEHEYGKWFTVEKPTETTDGYKERFCDLCGASEKEVLPALSASDVENNSSETSANTSSDSSNCQASISVVWVGGVLTAAAFVLMRRRETESNE